MMNLLLGTIHIGHLCCAVARQTLLLVNAKLHQLRTLMQCKANRPFKFFSRRRWQNWSQFQVMWASPKEL